MKFQKLNRVLHYWGALACSLPVLIVLITGILLLLKKESAWIQPPSMRGEGTIPTLSFTSILDTVTGVPEVGVESWEDIKLIDVRPSKGIVKVRTKDSWEVQLDCQSGEVLQVAYRRSDLIESLHDGSFFHDKVKLWIFLPSALLLLALWITGMNIFVITWWNKRKRRNKARTLKA